MSLVREFYKDAQKEWDRLDIPLCRIEFASTLALIDEYMAAAGKTVADIGGGPGRYTIELLERGCSVTLLDLSPENIALAQTKLAELGLCAEQALVGDARDLSALSGQASTGFWRSVLLSSYCKTRADRFLADGKGSSESRGVLITVSQRVGYRRSLLTDAPTWYADSSELTSLLNGDEFSGRRAFRSSVTGRIPNAPGRNCKRLASPSWQKSALKALPAAPVMRSPPSRNRIPPRKVVEFGVLTSKLPQYRNATDDLLLVGRS